jgi:hypothetical protein
MKDCEIIADRLRGQGWNLTWFPFLDRDGQTQWRVRASRSGGPQYTVQAGNLFAAVAGLENICQKAEMGCSGKS